MTFTLTEEELKKVSEWRNKGHNCKLTNVGAIGGKLTYCFTPTGLGVIFEVKCACGEKLNLTNYDEW